MGIFKLSDGARFNGRKWHKSPVYLFMPGYVYDRLYFCGTDKRNKHYYLRLEATTPSKVMKEAAEAKKDEQD